MKLNKRQSFILFALLYWSSETQAYFGLTGKSQLSDLWSINLDAASLATADKLDTWNEESDEPEPSREYKAVDMSLQPPKPIPATNQKGTPGIRKSEGSISPGGFDGIRKPAQFPSRTTRPVHDLDLQQDDSSGLQHGATSRSDDYRRRVHSSYASQMYRRNQLSRIGGGNSGAYRSNGRYRSATRQPMSSQGYYRHGRGGRTTQREGVRTTSSNEEHRSYTPRDTQAATRLAVPVRYRKTQPMSAEPGTLDQTNQDLSLDMAMIVNHSFSIPRVRSERESGKRRDLYDVRHNPKQYLVSSSVTHPISPSYVGYRREDGFGRRTSNRRLKPERHGKQQNQSHPIIQVSSTAFGNGVLEFDEEELSAYSAFIGSKMGNLTDMVEPQRINKKAARKLCNSFRLNSNQRKKCKRDPGLPQVLAKATHIAAAECLYQFRYERWNCSLGTSRIHLLNKGNKETAFLYSISSAGLTHSVARACAEGHLEKCSCEESFEDRVNQEAWLWGGCGDNVEYAAKFVRRFLRPQSENFDVRAEIDRHNSELGIRFVKSNVKHTCKCHGVSGSCTTKTCWRRMAPFYEIGRKIKRAYDKAVKVENISNSSGKPKLVRLKQRSKRQRLSTGSSRRSAHSSRYQMKKNSKTPHHESHQSSKLIRNNHRTRSTTDAPAKSATEVEDDIPKKKELVYIENSPGYCKKSKFSLGTKGRICGKESDCEKMCCGRGFTTHLRIIRKSCECQVKWCCYVQCKTCNIRKHIRTCK